MFMWFFFFFFWSEDFFFLRYGRNMQMMRASPPPRPDGLLLYSLNETSPPKYACKNSWDPLMRIYSKKLMRSVQDRKPSSIQVLCQPTNKQNIQRISKVIFATKGGRSIENSGHKVVFWWRCWTAWDNSSLLVVIFAVKQPPGHVRKVSVVSFPVWFANFLPHSDVPTDVFQEIFSNRRSNPRHSE